jgi:hypothetical protein
MHGITRENLRHCCVQPFSVSVDPDDRESGPREMWVVLHEPHEGGYSIAFDPGQLSWGVVERQDRGYVLVIAASTLAEALNGM